MMFRYGKIIESNSKTSRSDRFAEMSKQQQLIESKKQEIKAKFEERKRQEAEEALKRLNSKKLAEQKSGRGHKTSFNSRMQSWKNDDRWRKKQSTDSSEPSNSNSNFFSNDGSFLDKYKKMTGSKHAEENDYLHSSENEHTEMKYNDDSYYTTSQIRDDVSLHSSYEPNRKYNDCSKGIPFPPNLNVHPPSTMAVTSQQHLYPLTSHPPPAPPHPPSTIHTSLAAVPASVPIFTAVPSSGASLQTVSLIQVPVSVPASSVILSCPLETTLVTSEPVVHLPVVHSTLTPNSISVPLQTVPLQTAVIPAQIQIASQATVPPTSVQAVQINQSSANVILSQTLQPQSILVPSECIQQTQPNTSMSLPMVQAQTSQPPPPVHSVYSSMTSNSSVNFSVAPQLSQEPVLPPIHLPPPNYTPVVHHEESRIVSNILPSNCKNSQFNSEKDGYRNERSLITSESDDQCQRQRFLDDARRDEELEEMKAVANVVAECGDDMEELLLEKYQDDKLWFLREKMSPAYIAFRSMVEKIRKNAAKNQRKKEEYSSEDPEYSRRERRNTGDSYSQHSKIPADDDDSETDDYEDKRRRKRKRRSRWAPEDEKVDVPSASTLPTNSGCPSVPLPIGNIPVRPPAQERKLPGMSGPILSQVGRTDPALIQYAMKAFGTVNLSEEDWKKAEDHYKINLLYQDMLKKRQELERLQAAGKQKYAYDSDEDTEGGTWEHKLRQQEMVATQLWADEITERAKGKHHIGDFLPPDELERFLEKYNALKQGREPDLSDYKEFKLKEDNIGFQMLQKLGWSEGQGLGTDGGGIVNPVNKAPTYTTNYGLGVEKPDDISRNDDEYDAYRKRMMLAYRFRPNPLNNPRRPYY